MKIYPETQASYGMKPTHKRKPQKLWTNWYICTYRSEPPIPAGFTVLPIYVYEFEDLPPIMNFHLANKRAQGLSLPKEGVV